MFKKCQILRTSVFVCLCPACDNCVKLDQISIAGLVIGDVIATIVIGVAVYLIVSQAGPGPGPITSHKKSKINQ